MKDLASLLSNQKERIAFPESAFDSPKRSSPQKQFALERRGGYRKDSQSSLKEASRSADSDRVVPISNIRFVKTRRQKPVPPQMDSVVQEESDYIKENAS